MKEIKVVITDLDDTIWDWLTMWYESFDPYLRRILFECDVDRTELISDFKKLHNKYHTSEVSYAFKELKSIKRHYYKLFENDSVSKISILHEYYCNKRDSFKLYDGVKETLLNIKAKGTKIIGFTESNIFYTEYRIKTLQLVFETTNINQYLIEYFSKERNYDKNIFSKLKICYVEHRIGSKEL